MKVTFSSTLDIGLGSYVTIQDAQINPVKVSIKNQRDGMSDRTRLISAFLDTKYITFSGTLTTQNGTLPDYYEAQKLIAHTLRPEPGYLIDIVIETSTGVSCKTQGILQSFSPTNNASSPNFGAYNLDFYLPDPYFYSLTPSTYSCGLQNAGLYLDFYLDQSFTVQNGYNLLAFNNDGLITYPFITITGSTRNLRIVNQIGDIFQIGSIDDPFLLIGARQILIDANSRLITLDGQSIYYVTSGWEALKIYPGANTWSIDTDGYNDATSQVQISFSAKNLTVL